ncbi:GNAT family N-acetyltransferase [Modestobacter sp. I12A-02628]|uniref:GNAT family N-acetyltransferase n=1 Tax=Goekera deserti TaxID=2497753 RepID=A0A7K3WG34_9ACTN|nr:GNAT family N-acetyltransferase [Goekera deserti]MPR00380.1 GNAT family N-acetyltransferase [Goekera deserti]NDI50417.1 GNAT family N-acetyltransferase [Goekera deserti]NEL55316.1 GNAT family N-acetyltransferase [Goekera deserti]
MTSSPPVRAARFAELTPAELYGLLRLRVDVFVVEQTCPYPELDGRDAEPGTLHLWVPGPDGEVLSTLRLLHDGEDRAIGRVCTAAGARGRGLSELLLRQAIALCDGRRIDIGAQAHLEGWYGRLGFVRTGPDYVEDGIPHCHMAILRIAPPPGGVPELR